VTRIDCSAASARPGTTSNIPLRLQNYGLQPQRYRLAVEGVPDGWTATLLGGGQPSRLEVHPDFWSDDRPEAISIDEIRFHPERGAPAHDQSLQQFLSLKPFIAPLRVALLANAERMTEAAQNCLLKTLEEPPEWAVFVLCTTEVHKIPNTIGSRCQQFSFRSVEFGELMERMQFIAREEGIEADADTLAVIAQSGEGSVRDSLSALDQAIACCGNVLKVETVRSLLGMFGAESLRTVAEAVRDENGERMLEIVQELEHSGQNLQHYCRELVRYWRNLLVARISGKTTRLIAASDREQQVMQVRDLEAWITGLPEYSQQRFIASLFAIFSVLALILAVVGLYSVVSYGVATRTNEFGIRMALGAKGSDVFRIVFSSTAINVGAGLASGLLLCIAFDKLSTRWVMESSRNPWILAGVTLILIAAAALACFVPARRAS